MPAQPSNSMLQKMGLAQPPKVKGAKLAKPNFMSGSQTIDDILMGLVGQDTGSNTNKFTQLLSAGLPVASGLGKLSQGRKLLPTKIPSTKGTPIFDDAGRYLAMNNPADEVYSAHIGSSKGKFDIKKQPMMGSPSEQALDRMMARRKQ